MFLRIKLRKRIGEKKLTELFNRVTKSLEAAGYVGNVFHFVDASALRSKVAIWKARDKAIADKENEERDDDGKPKMNNKNISDYSSDPDATILKNNRKDKNKDLDRYRSSIRIPFEGTFSKQDRFTRYWTTPKVLFQATMEAFVLNFKRLIQIDSGPLDLRAGA